MTNDTGWNSHIHGPDDGLGLDCREKPIGQCVRNAKDAELAQLRAERDQWRANFDQLSKRNLEMAERHSEALHRATERAKEAERSLAKADQ